MRTFEGITVEGEIMTPEIEGLRLMCLFMDGEIDDGVYHIINANKEHFNYVKGKAHFDTGSIAVAELRYSSDYNKLMEVWRKFRDLKFEFYTAPHQVHFKWSLNFRNALVYKSCEEAFLLLAEAIKWYNSLKPKTDE